MDLRFEKILEILCMNFIRIEILLLYIFLSRNAFCINCIDGAATLKVSQETPKGLKEVPVSLVLATLGTDVRLPCHYCSELSGLSGRVWHRRSLHGMEKEVELDMHDDPTKNRVFVVEDHSLVIRQITPKDGAYYFCYDVENATGIAKMDILLDIDYKTTLDPFILNTKNNLEQDLSKWLETCQKLKETPALSQYACYVEWGAWSRCDSCGKIGERKRVGQCRIQKLVKAQIETPQGNVIEADFPIVGVGCHSVLLDDVSAAKEVLNKIPNIVLLEKCQISCEGLVTKASRLKVFRKSSFLKKIKMAAVKKLEEAQQTVKAEVREEKEGKEIALFCPGADLDSKIKWKLNGRLMKPEKLKRKTAGRMYIDATDVLHIKSLQIKDEGEYTCTLYELEIGLIRLKDPTSNFGILTLSLLFSFILWCTLMSVRWTNFMMQRRVQQMRMQKNKKVVTQENDSEDSFLDTDNEESTSTSETSI